MSIQRHSLAASLAAALSERVGGELFSVPLSPGLSLRVLKAGQGAPLVLIHTIRTQLDYFGAIIDQLAATHTVYAIDLPAHGYSSIDVTAPLDEPYFRKAVIQFLETLDLTGVTLVGESIGGALALTIAASVPDRVARIVSINPYDYETRYGDGIRRGSGFANFIIGSLQIPVLGAFNAAMENQIVLKKIMSGGYHDPRKFPLPLLEAFDGAAKQKGYKVAARKLLSNWRSWSEARKLYSNIRAETTIIYGQYDWSRPAERQRTIGDVKNARSFEVKNGGHFLSVECPDDVVSIILGRTRAAR